MATEIDPAYYQCELSRTKWTIPKRYQALQALAGGAYGSVVSANDTSYRTDEGTPFRVAIKKLKTPFQTEIHARRAYRELQMLKHLQHDNIICLTDVFTPAKIAEDFHEIYFVTQLLDCDLTTVLKNQRLHDEQIQLLIYQLLCGVNYMHSAGIIHRDLKPSNIAVNANCDLRILDFGLARLVDTEMTGYVATRWYRAPEIMFNWMHYTTTVDIWSVGCIMSEMITNQPLFPGTDHIDQLQRIMSIVGKPDAEFMQKIVSEDARRYIDSLPEMPKRDLKQFYSGCSNAHAVELLERMLELDPDRRITAPQALAHIYLERYHDPEFESTCTTFHDDFESATLPIAKWKEMIFEGIKNYTANPETLGLAVAATATAE